MRRGHSEDLGAEVSCLLCVLNWVGFSAWEEHGPIHRVSRTGNPSVYLALGMYLGMIRRGHWSRCVVGGSAWAEPGLFS